MDPETLHEKRRPSPKNCYCPPKFSLHRRVGLCNPRCQSLLHPCLQESKNRMMGPEPETMHFRSSSQSYLRANANRAWLLQPWAAWPRNASWERVTYVAQVLGLAVSGQKRSGLLSLLKPRSSQGSETSARLQVAAHG